MDFSNLKEAIERLKAEKEAKTTSEYRREEKMYSVIIRMFSYALILLLFGIIGILLGSAFNIAAIWVCERFIGNPELITSIYKANPAILLIVMGIFTGSFMIIGFKFINDEI